MLNDTYHDGAPIKPIPLVIDVCAEAENPFLGDMYAKVKLPGTIILNYLKPGTLFIY